MTGLHNVAQQRPLTFSMSLLSITNSLIFLTKPRLKSSLLTIFMISKSTWKKVLNLQFALYTRSKYLSQFNLIIRFHSSCLGTKPDTLTRQQDVYFNSHNFKPIFTQEQLVASIQVTVLFFFFLHIVTVVDLDTLH